MFDSLEGKTSREAAAKKLTLPNKASAYMEGQSNGVWWSTVVQVQLRLWINYSQNSMSTLISSTELSIADLILEAFRWQSLIHVLILYALKLAICSVLYNNHHSGCGNHYDCQREVGARYAWYRAYSWAIHLTRIKSQKREIVARLALHLQTPILYMRGFNQALIQFETSLMSRLLCSG